MKQPSSFYFHTLLLLLVTIRLSKSDDDVNYTHEVALLPDDRLYLQYRLDAFNFTTNSVMPLLSTTINGTNSSNANIISFKMTYKGSSWLSLGISPNDQGLMIGSQAIIGEPLEPNSVVNPAKYYMFEYFEDGVVQRQTQEQNLINATISQISYDDDNVTTILAFTKLTNDDDISIDVNGNQTFIYAFGGRDQKYPSYHAVSGSVTIDLSATADTTETTTTTTTATSNRKSVFLTHAVLLSVAWGYLAPMAVGGSLFRHVLPSSLSWIKIHIYSNVVGLMLTLAGFIMVVVTRWNSNSTRWSHSHFILGWVMMCLVVVQIISGYLRPKAEEPKDDSTTKTSYVGRIRSGSIRAVWEVCHKLLGVSLLIAGIFQAVTGINLLMPYGVTSSFVWLYWGGWIVTIFIIGVFFCLSRKNES